MKTIWKGSISFGLVSIPVKLYSAIESKSSSFRLLHRKDLAPIKYKRFCVKENKEVAWEDIVKGVEISKGNFVPITDEELEKLKPEKTSNIDVIEFTDVGQIDPIYYNSHYFMVPQNEKDKAYFLFQKVLQSTGKLAIARFVMREKEYICALRYFKNGMLLTTLNYSYEVRNIDKLEELKSMPQLKKEELQLANDLINRLYEEEFQISKFRDTFQEDLKEIVEKKGKGIEIKAPKKRKEKKEENLIHALRASLK